MTLLGSPVTVSPGPAKYDRPSEVRERQCCFSVFGAWVPRLTPSNPGIPAILEYRLLAAGLRHLGLGTWQPAILEYRLLAAGLRHLGLGTQQPAILESRGITIEGK